MCLPGPATRIDAPISVTASTGRAEYKVGGIENILASKRSPPRPKKRALAITAISVSSTSKKYKTAISDSRPACCRLIKQSANFYYALYWGLCV